MPSDNHCRSRLIAAIQSKSAKPEDAVASVLDRPIEAAPTKRSYLLQ